MRKTEGIFKMITFKADEKRLVKRKLEISGK